MQGRIIHIFLATCAFLLLSSCSVEKTQQEIPGLPEQRTAQIPPGWFLMGEDSGRLTNQPQRQVYLDEYEIQVNEVTRADFARFIESTGYQAPGWIPGSSEEDDLPVVGVLWEDADAYCRWLGMRLPTEAEWEKAARGTDGRRFPWGDEWDVLKANTQESNLAKLLPVGSYPGGSSPYGILDMTGNAAEWVSDYFDPSYYSYAPDRNPIGPEKIMDRVLRGGSFAGPAEFATTFFRDSSHSDRPNYRVGFRCAKSLD
jgi:formylglycine-generating enzyme required for sulfatase activity